MQLETEKARGMMVVQAGSRGDEKVQVICSSEWESWLFEGGGIASSLLRQIANNVSMSRSCQRFVDDHTITRSPLVFGTALGPRGPALHQLLLLPAQSLDSTPSLNSEAEYRSL